MRHQIIVDGFTFHATIKPLTGIDSGLFEATCREFPDLSDYAGSTKKAVHLLRDSIVTSLDAYKRSIYHD